MAACSGSGTESGPDSSDQGGGEIQTLNWGALSIRAIDYASSFDVQTGTPVAIALESLLIYDQDVKLAPLLAESWSQPDPLTYVFKTRQGVKFWDGSPLTAEDVAYSIQRHMDPKVASQMSFFFESVDSIEVTGPAEVTVRLKRPDPFFAHVQTFTSVTPKAFSEAQGDNLGAPGGQVTTMGTGPYRITAFRADEEITLVRNENYWGEQPSIAEVNLKLFQDPQTLQLAMQSAEIDGTFNVPAPQASQFDDIDGVTLLTAAGMSVLSMYFRTDLEPWNDIHVRRAFAHSIDREGLVRNLLRGYGDVATALVPPAQWGGLVPPAEIESVYAALPLYGFDIEMAKQELAQSSVPEGFSASIDYPSILPELGKALLNLAENLKQLNIDLTVTEVNPNAWFDELNANPENPDHPIGVFGFAPDYADPADYLSGAYGQGANENEANYNKPEIAQLLEQQQSATSDTVRAESIAQIMQTAEADLPYLNLWWPDTLMAVTDRFTYDFSPLWYQQVWIRYLRST